MIGRPFIRPDMPKVRRRWLADRLRDDANSLIDLGFVDLSRQLRRAAADIVEQQAPADKK
jgi:hypothetical protein